MSQAAGNVFSALHSFINSDINLTGILGKLLKKLRIILTPYETKVYFDYSSHSAVFISEYSKTYEYFHGLRDEFNTNAIILHLMRNAVIKYVRR